MLFKKIAIERIKICLSKVITSEVKKKRIRRGSYRMKLFVPYLDDSGVKHFEADAVFMPNKSHLFIEKTFTRASLDDHVREHKHVLPSAIKEEAIQEIYKAVYTAFEQRDFWKPGKGKNYIYSASIGTLSIRLSKASLVSAP